MIFLDILSYMRKYIKYIIKINFICSFYSMATRKFLNADVVDIRVLFDSTVWEGYRKYSSKAVPFPSYQAWDVVIPSPPVPRACYTSFHQTGVL